MVLMDFVMQEVDKKAKKNPTDRWSYIHNQQKRKLKKLYEQEWLYLTSGNIIQD
jgi:hypothetical protein